MVFQDFLEKCSFFTVVEMLGNLGEDFVVGDFLEERVSPDVL
jgi:hypothetical protein